jgi:hypothetical protein
MPGRPHRLLRRLAQLALTVLLLAPLVAGAHVHGFGTEASPACGVCTVAKHAPAVVGPTVLAAAITYRTLATVHVPLAPSCAGRCWRPAGRAPPAAPSRQLT